MHRPRFHPEHKKGKMEGGRKGGKERRKGACPGLGRKPCFFLAWGPEKILKL
jgi:hypothetical protein